MSEQSINLATLFGQSPVCSGARWPQTQARAVVVVWLCAESAFSDKQLNWPIMQLYRGDEVDENKFSFSRQSVVRAELLDEVLVQVVR